MSKQNDKLNRRTVLQLIPASLLARAARPDTAPESGPCGTHNSEFAKATEPYRYQFFTPEEVTLVDMLMEKIIPADQHSPGAHDAKTVDFADLMLSTSPDYVKEDWRNALNQLATQLKTTGADAWLESASQNQDNPQTPLDLFFVALKDMTINGYYTSAIGIHQDLQYQGNTYVVAFHGCDHPEHQS